MGRSAQVIIELRGVSVLLPRGQGLHAGSITIEAGQRVALFGSAGAGKSLLLRLIAGALRPHAGERIAAPSLRTRGAVRFVPRVPKLPSFLTPQQLLTMAYRRMGPVHRAARTAEVLAAADLYPVRHRPLYALSDASRLALAIAKAAGERPVLLLLDDCLSALSEPASRRMWQYLDERREEDGVTIVHATSHTDEAEAADIVVMMDGGRVLKAAPPNELLALAPAHRIVVEALDAHQVSRTIRGAFDIEVEEATREITVRVPDAAAGTADLLRHAGDVVRMVTMRRPSLWDVLAELRRQPYTGQTGSHPG